MKLSTPSIVNSVVATQMCAFFSLALIIAAFETNMLFIAVLPLVAGLGLAMVFYPRSILYVYLLSFFWGQSLINKGILTLVCNDIGFTILLLGYAAAFYRGKFDFSTLSINRRILNPLLFIFLLAIVSFVVNFGSYEPKFAVICVWYMLRIIELIFVFILFSDRRCHFNLEHGVSLCLAGFLVQLPVAFFQAASTADLDYAIGRMAVIGTFTNHHAVLGTMELFGLALCLYRFLKSTSLRAKALYAVLAGCVILTIMLSGARGPLLGIGIAGLLFCILNFRFKLSYILYLLLGIAVLVIAIKFSPLKKSLDITFGNTTSTSIDASSLSRVLIWKGGINHFITCGITQKLIGVGLGAYPTIKYNVVLEGNKKMSWGGHNNFLTVIVELGIFGLIAFIYFFWNVMDELRKRMKTDPFAYSFFYLTITLLASTMTQETFWFQPTYIILWPFYAVFLVRILQPKVPLEAV
jgi:O-antigen ligase